MSEVALYTDMTDNVMRHLHDQSQKGCGYDWMKFGRLVEGPTQQAGSWGGWALDGWNLVPVHPTKEMRDAGAKIGNQGWDFAHHTWRTMLLHAPAAPQQATTALTDGQIKELAGMHGGYLEDCDAWNFCGDRGLVRFARSLLATSPVKESSNG